MGNHMRTYEVKVEVNKRGSEHFSFHMGRYVENKITKTFHIRASRAKQAKQKAEKRGRVVKCRKVNAPQFIERRAIVTESLPLGLQAVNSYPVAIAMDDFIWKKQRRAERVNNQVRDHNSY